MCRMLYLETDVPRDTTKMIARFALKWWAADNPHGTGVAYADPDGVIRIVKGIIRPKKAFRKLKGMPTRLAGHVRRATDGSVSQENAHPFVSCDGRSAFMHNGVIFNWKPLRERLMARGHKFTSQTDSEVMLHLAEEVGPKKLTEAIQKENVSGMANWIWISPEKTIVFSDGSLWMVRNELGIRFGFFSDLDWAEKDFFKTAKFLSGGTMVTIHNGKHKVKNIGTIPAERPSPVSPVTYSDWWRQESMSVEADEKMTTVYGESIEDALRRIHPPSDVEVAEEAWIKSGDLFCKRCNIVYNESTSGQCIRCHQELVDVAEMI